MLCSGASACHRYGMLYVLLAVLIARSLSDDGFRPKHVGASPSDF